MTSDRCEGVDEIVVEEKDGLGSSLRRE